MLHHSRVWRVSLTSFLAVAAIEGCAGSDPLSGSHIVDEMERRHIPMPDDAGDAPADTSHAGLPASGPITLADLLNVAEARSPDLAAARSSVGMAAGQAWQASMYPNPRVDVSVEDISLRDGPEVAKTTVGFTQPVVLGNRLQAAVDAAGAEQAARLADIEVQRRTLFGNVAAQHARLISLREQRRSYVELRELANRTVSAAQSRFEAKAAPETDAIRPRVEMYRLDATLARLKQDEASARKQLGYLLGGIEVDAERLEGTILLTPQSLDVEHLTGAVRASHPLLMSADREIDAAQARIARLHAEQTPDLDVRLAAGYRGDADDGIVEVGAGMSIPLWDTKKGDAVSARFELMRARQRRLGAENDLLGRLAEAVGEYESARVQLDTFRDNVVPDAQRAFDQTVESYRGGRSSFLDMLDSQRTLTEARTTLIELASAVTAARARVAMIVGPHGFDVPAEPPVTEVRDVLSISQERQNGAEVSP